MITTLNKILAHDPCTDGWKKLLQHLGKTEADDEPLSIVTILDSNGLDDAIWSLRAAEGCEREIRLFSVFCARQVQHLMNDERSLSALDVAERFSNGDATEKELFAAGAAARAAWAAARAAADAARAAADAAWAAADAAGAAARAAAWTAAGAAAWAAARAAADAADAAWVSADAVWDRAAAGVAARETQESELRRVCAAIDAARGNP